MKRISLFILAVVVCGFFSSNVDAKSLRGVTLRNNADVENIVNIKLKHCFILRY